jgi:hypothetical protein
MSTHMIKMITTASLAVVLAGGVAGPAAAGGTHFKGKTEQGPKVTFTVKPKSVSGFKTSASVLCVSVVTGRSVMDIYPVLLQSPVKVKKGKFTIHLTGDDGLDVTANGKVTGDHAKGSLKIRYNKVIGSTSTGLLDIAACLADTTWTAKAK